MTKNLFFFIGLGVVLYLILKNKSDSTENAIYETTGYIPPQADPSTATPVKSNPTKPTTKTTPAKPATATKPATPAKTTTAPPIVIKRTICKAKYAVNIREIYSPDYKVIRKAYTGEILGDYITQLDLTINKQKSTFVCIKAKNLFPGINDHIYVLKSAIDFVY